MTEDLLSNRILCLNIFGAYKNTLVKLYKQNEMKPETGSRVDKQALQVSEYSLTTQNSSTTEAYNRKSNIFFFK